MAAVTHPKYIVPVHHLSEPTAPSSYPFRCHQISSNQNISTSYDSSCFARDNFLSSCYHSLGCDNHLSSQETNGNSIQLSQNLNEFLSVKTLCQKNKNTMTSHNHHSSESRVISSNDIKTTTKQRSKSMGNFASSLAKSRRRKSSDSHNNNGNSDCGRYDNIRNERNSTHHHTVMIPTPAMTSAIVSDNQNSDECRVPVNGEATQEVSNPSGAMEVPPQVGVAPSTTQQQTLRRDSNVSSRKNSLISSSTGIGNLNPYDPKYREFMIGAEPWKDDSLSLSSSFSSSLSSLPSPPSPASPPSYRPQSLPQTADIVLSDTELLSSSLPDTAFQTTFCSSSCGGSPRKKRVKDSEGFIRRAACVCLNEAETEVLLVSSKSSSEVWLVPGGGLEDGEEAQQAALREAYEEAGVRGTILAYLGLFESRPELSSSGKKHRTAVYVVRVMQEEDSFPEAITLGRQTKWMTVDDALAQLSRHRPRQSVYLQLLRATRLNARTGTDGSSTTTIDTASTIVDTASTIDTASTTVHTASTIVDQTAGQTTTVVVSAEASRRKETTDVVGVESQTVCTNSEDPGLVPISRKSMEGEGNSLNRLEEVEESQFEQDSDDREMPSDLQMVADQLSELELTTPRIAELDSESPASTSGESLVALRKSSSDLRSDVTLESDSSQETEEGEEVTAKECDEILTADLKKTSNVEVEENSVEEPSDLIEGSEEGS